MAFTAFYDASVLYPAPLRDLLMRLALTNLFRARWSATVHEEWIRPPLRDGVQAGDYSTALFNVLGVLAALLRRDRDGQGQVVDVAMFEAVLRLTGDMLAVRSALGIRRERAGGEWPVYPSSLTAQTADGRFIAASSASWDDVFSALERLGMPRPEDGSQARHEIERFIGALPADEAVRALRRAGLPASPVNSIADLVRENPICGAGEILYSSPTQSVVRS